MMMVDICEPTAYHVEELASKLRNGDLRELAVAGVSPRDAVWGCYRHSLYRRVALVDGSPAVMWGVGGTLLGVGELWMLTTPLVETIPFSFIREARKEVAKLRVIFPLMIGAVLCDYVSAVKFVKVLGFTLEEGTPFMRFSMES